MVSYLAHHNNQSGKCFTITINLENVDKLIGPTLLCRAIYSAKIVNTALANPCRYHHPRLDMLTIYTKFEYDDTIFWLCNHTRKH